MVSGWGGGGENECEVWCVNEVRREAIVTTSGGGRGVDVERLVAVNCFNGCEGWEKVSFGRKL